MFSGKLSGNLLASVSVLLLETAAYVSAPQGYNP